MTGGSGQLAERIKVPERIVTEKRLDLKREADAPQVPENWQKKARLKTGFFFMNLAFSRRPLREMPELLH